LIKKILNFYHRKHDFKSQLFRSSKAIPEINGRRICQKTSGKGFLKKYLDNALTEVNETSVGLSQISDLYKE